MGKLRTETWEFSRADYFASLTRQVMTEGASGGEEVEPILTAALYDGADALVTAAKVRAAAYATFRALERGAPWQTLALASGWSSYNQPEWRIDPFGYVELRGAVTGGSGTIATLPAGSWPTRSDQFLVGAAHGGGHIGMAQLTISTAGVLALSGLGNGSSAAYITLAGVRWHLT